MADEKMYLYKLIEDDDGNERYELASLDDVSQFFNDIYPPDIFIKHPIAKIRDLLNRFVNPSKYNTQAE
jgi:hypothetical protein